MDTHKFNYALNDFTYWHIKKQINNFVGDNSNSNCLNLICVKRRWDNEETPWLVFSNPNETSVGNRLNMGTKPRKKFMQLITLNGFAVQPNGQFTFNLFKNDIAFWTKNISGANKIE